jgi:hypothetical protein
MNTSKNKTRLLAEKQAIELWMSAFSNTSNETMRIHMSELLVRINKKLSQS